MPISNRYCYVQEECRKVGVVTHDHLPYYVRMIAQRDPTSACVATKLRACVKSTIPASYSKGANQGNYSLNSNIQAACQAMTSRDLRRQVLSGTDQLRQQLIQAVDRLDQDFQPRPQPPNIQQGRSVSVPASISQDFQPRPQPPNIQQSRSVSVPASISGQLSLPAAATTPIYSPSSVPIQPTYSPLSLSSPPTIESTLRRQSTSLFCHGTNPRARTFAWNPRTSIGLK